jgi:hypothetical protein
MKHPINRIDKKNIFFMKWILNEVTRIIFVVIEIEKFSKIQCKTSSLALSI